MLPKNAARVTLVSAALFSALAPAHAYERWKSKDLNGNVIHGIKCDNGDRWLSGNGSIPPTDADAARICNKHGSSMTTGQNPAIRAERSPSTLSR